MVGPDNLLKFEKLEELTDIIREKDEELLKLKAKHHEIAVSIEVLSLEEIRKEITFLKCSEWNEYSFVVENFNEEDLEKVSKMFPYLSLYKEEDKTFFILSGASNYNFFENEDCY